ncbi:MAG: Fis family transcriptional regulator [Epsilonproteobacteria bacterium]|nr:MAG: Fis family transcriptional regulator [Campylobacterota bacterium]
MKLEENLKSDFDEFLEDENILTETNDIAIKRIIAYQLEQEMKVQKINQSKMANMMNTSRSAVSRLLNPDNTSLTLNTLNLATSVLGKKLNISIA